MIENVFSFLSISAERISNLLVASSNLEGLTNKNAEAALL